MDANQYGPWALVTGASRGLGKGFARALAERGLNVVLVARNKTALAALSSEIETQFAVDTKVIACDLADENAVAKMIAGTKELEIGLLVNNAAMVMGGSLLKHRLDDEMRMLAVNIGSPLGLTHHFAELMKQRGSRWNHIRFFHRQLWRHAIYGELHSHQIISDVIWRSAPP